MTKKYMRFNEGSRGTCNSAFSIDESMSGHFNKVSMVLCPGTMGPLFVFIPEKMPNDKIQMSNGGWGPIEYNIGRIPSFDIWAWTLGFECCGAASAIMPLDPFFKLFPGHNNRSHLKKVFWPNLGVGSGFQILDILQYACGLKPGSAYILDQNPFFEMAYSCFLDAALLYF